MARNSGSFGGGLGARKKRPIIGPLMLIVAAVVLITVFVMAWNAGGAKDQREIAVPVALPEKAA